MTNVFQPNVFQPNVFQVGTLDVATKRRKWLSLSVPGSGKVSGVSAFAVSRDSAGILIGVRDKAAPQFGVVRDSGGLLLGGWPAKAPLLTSYVASGYVLGIAAVGAFRLQILYWDAAFSALAGSDPVASEGTTSLTDWQRVCVTAPVPVNAAYVSARIYCQRSTPAGVYWTAMRLEGGVVASAYGVGGAPLLLNSEFATDLSCWSEYGLLSLEISNPLAGVFSRATSLPSAPLSGVTTAIKYVSDRWDPAVWFQATHRTVALPT